MAETVNRAFGLEPSHLALLEFFEYAMTNERSMLFAVNGIASGIGAFQEGQSVALPAGMMQDFGGLDGMPVWSAEIRFKSFGIGPDRVTHIALERLVAISAIVFMEYGRATESSWDPWAQIANMQTQCTRRSQARLIPSEIREHLAIADPD